MFKTILATGLALVWASTPAIADLEPWKDYEPSEAVWYVTTVKVDSNMGDAYLEGLRDTWIPGNEAAKKLGHIEDYRIYRSDLPESGDFNLMLLVKMKDTASTAPSKERYDAFIKAVTKKKSDKMTERAQKDYPGMRKLTGTYMMREITIK